MNQVISINKPRGYTPLQTIKHFREQYPEYALEKISYAGRLDPMAQGILLLLIGEANKERDQYLSFSKSYEFTCIFGIETDSYDQLGILAQTKLKSLPKDWEKRVMKFLDSKKGSFKQSYPPYSAKPVKGQPLFWWAKQALLSTIEIPFKEVAIHNFEVLTIQEMTIHSLQKKIISDITSVQGNFRQGEILKRWQQFFDTQSTLKIQTVTFRVTGSTGLYVRSIVQELGQLLATGAVTINILRTQVGDYTLKDCRFVV